MTEELKNKILNLIEEKHIEEAINLCNESIEKDNKDEDAYFYIAICKFDLKNYEESIKYFNKVIELNPNNEKAYFNRGLSKAYLQIYEESLKDFDISIKLNPNIDNTYLEKSNVLLDINKYEDAIENLNKAITLNQNNSYAYFNRGIAKSNLGRYEDAIDDYNRAIELNSNNEEIYVDIGIAKSNLGKYEESIEYYNKAIKLNPNNSDAYLNRGISKGYLGKYESSINDFNKSIELTPNDENSYFNRGISKAYLRRYEESINDYNKVIELNSNNSDAYLNRGASKFNLEIYEEAIKDFNKVIELNPNANDVYFNLGISNFNLKKYVDAIENFNKAIELNSNNEESYFFRGFSKIYLENENAIDDIRSFLKINKNYNIYIITILQEFYEYYNIEKLFNFMVNIKNNELWENEPITNLLSRFDESKNFDDELKKNIKYLLLYEYFLLKILTFDIEENNNIEISHYTSLDILPLLLNVKVNTKESGNIRINNITTANDPKEGKILERILNKNNIDIKIESDEKALTLQTSYSRNKDSLTMFRLYGKKENKEATGICLVLNNEYFNNSYTSPYSYEFKLKTENNSKEKNKEEYNEKINEEKSQENKRNLYWVLYYNEKENQLIYNKEKSKYASNIIDLNDLNNPNYKAELKEDDTKENMIKYAFAKIFYYTKEIKKEVDKNYQNIKNQLYSYLFENIKYIIKHEAFFEEQELRMLVTNDYKSDEILIDNDKKKLYIDYMPLFDERTNYIKEIIIGSKVENNEAVAEYIRKVLHIKNTEMNKLDDIKVSISEAPLR
ncbi:tetratricopeptide repeat protein [Brachyspira pilosicoli]|uniref:TPR domain-containing protein n=1 Tax=Brachyspira pilosicoli (strain ATCC BAA-1826 / 95/1000) TaxID=759914 RepID=D8IDZ4_BRAP9|nr:tetratricopeptide repeat protein [Brachyspira pilosicoli]ADK31367.1 TPR domain-containing protein [Brachyspira pilosicoli 95/1000]